jgi:dienelactone hydrolase
MKRAIRTTIRLTIVAALMVLVTITYFYTKDYGGYFHERKGALDEVKVSVVGSDSLFERSWLTLKNAEGLTVDCGMLVPRSQGKRHPVIILLGGKATGKHAIDYAIGVDDVIIVAPDYPYDPKDSYTLMEFLTEVPAMRSALLDMVPSVMLVMDYLWQRDDVDTTKIVLLGYSFGAPLVPPIVVHDRRATVAALVYGGGDLNSLIRHNVRRYEGPATSTFVAALGALLLRPIEPLRYAEDISPTPLIMINGTHDEQIPSANAQLLYEKAREPKNILWLESRHVHPQNVDLTRRIVETLVAELRRLGVLNSGG